MSKFQNSHLVDNKNLEFSYNDGGRSNYFKGDAGDCVVRAIAIATDTDYKVIYDTLYQANKDYLDKKNTKLSKQMKSRTREKGGSPRNGNYKKIYQDYLLNNGWRYVSLRKFGSKERVKLDELTHLGTILVNINRHMMCMKNGTIHDTWDSRFSYWEERKAIRTANGYYERIAI